MNYKKKKSGSKIRSIMQKAAIRKSRLPYDDGWVIYTFKTIP